MLRRIAVCMAILCLTGPLLAQNSVQLTPRVPFAKRPSDQIVLPKLSKIRLIVKFNDSLRVRATVDGRVNSLANNDMSNVLNIAAQNGVTFRQAINHSLDKLAMLENRAGAFSKRGQPDLGGIMYVLGGTPDVMLKVARALNSLPEVEYVEFEPDWIPTQDFNGKNEDKDTGKGGIKNEGTGGGPLAGGGGIACGDPMAVDCNTENPDAPYCNDVLCCEEVCLFDPACCEDAWDNTCVKLADAFCGDNPELVCGEPVAGSCFVAHVQFHKACNDFECCETVCVILPDCCDISWDQECANVALDSCGAQCGDADTKSCFEPHPPGFSKCTDANCCDSVCLIDPGCCEVVWDLICVAVAYQICVGGDPCGNQFNGLCREPHGGLGCRYADCCNDVCTEDAFCCNTAWDQICADAAALLCAATPDFTDLQGYKTPEWYFDDFGDNPPHGLSPSAPSTFGFTGEGFNLPGLWDFGEFVLGLGGNGNINRTRGKGARIGIIEHSAWVDHEDLIGKVISEPGQTIIHYEGEFISSNHGTATLGIVSAKNNGIGITGMAPEAESYFFPIVSVEEGGRLISAMIAAALVFEHGDVLSFSIGPIAPTPRTLESFATTNLALRILTDLGVICCIAAGNDCGNLDDNDPDYEGLSSLPYAGAPDSGAITVGAGWPGSPFCRLGFSNHGNCNGRVHCQAWGESVTTTGYGDLFDPSLEGEDINQRKYTSSFNGTSAATPMIASIAANLQGISKMFFGIPLMPEQIRDLIAVTGDINQCGFDIPCASVFGQIEILNCLGDGDPDEPPNAIGKFPDLVVDAERIIVGNWFDGSPFIDSIEILRGTLVSGNVFSIKESDDNRLVIKSEFTHPNDNQGLGINYFGTGQITDLLVHAHIDDLSHPFNNLFITNERQESDVPFACAPGGVIPSGNGLNFYEMWNWTTNKWQFIIFDPSAGEDCGIPGNISVVDASERFVRQGDGEMQLRIWSLSLGGTFGGFGGGGTQPYFIRHDHINIQALGLGGGVNPTPP